MFMLPEILIGGKGTKRERGEESKIEVKCLTRGRQRRVGGRETGDICARKCELVKGGVLQMTETQP